jgi:hypothetical protein
MKHYYAGIGSRQTPSTVCTVMTFIARKLEKQGYILRSGAAEGADTAFENGVAFTENTEIFYPNDLNIPERAFEIAAEIHPAWHMCNEFAKYCHARNILQVLGRNLQTPVDFVICWTVNGAKKGGTRTAIVLAEKLNIPVYNLATNDIFNFIDISHVIKGK